MTLARPLAVTGIGIECGLGGAAQACAAMRAGMTRFTLSDNYACRPFDEVRGELEPPRIAPARTRRPGASGAVRLLELALPAVGEALASAGLSRDRVAQLSLHLALAEPDRPGREGDERHLRTELWRRAGLPAPAAGATLRAGHLAVPKALLAASERLEADGGGLALVLAVDSLVEAEQLAWLDARGRVKCERCPEGVIAGEAACAWVVERIDDARERRAPTRLIVRALAEDREPVAFGEGPCTGAGLARALDGAVGGLSRPPAPPWVLSDHNGDRERALDWGYVVTRRHKLLSGLRDTWHVADTLGETGAAVGGLLASRAAHAFARAHAPGESALLVLSADDGGRAAAVLRAPGGR